ncbi:MAG: DUF11 domain-containing protein [Erythrobacter sp.]|nr:DUF11 domain-containing protein [Erythrobacter sp.]
MIGVVQPLKRMLSAAVVLLAMALLLAPRIAAAQNADIDWADAGVASLTPFPSGTTVTGSDGTTATVTWSTQTDGGTFQPAFGGDFVSYFSGQIGAGQSPLLTSFNNSAFDPDDRVTIDITLSRAVGNLEFALSDIDLGSFTDAIEVYYDDDLTGGFSNAASNTAFWSTGPSVTRTNDAVVNGWRGIAGSATSATDGDIAFDFNAQQVRRIRIVYFSYTGTGDPTGQFAGISDLAFDGQGADLSLTKSLIGSPPVTGGTATWRLTVVNSSDSTETANGIIVEDTFPAGFNFSSASGDGTFNSGNGQWNVGTLAPGASASITLTGTVTAATGTTLTNVAEIIASSANDPDSTVNNGVTTEDDYATSSITVQSGRAPGVPPILACPAGQSVFDWDAISGWTAGSTDNTYAFSTFGNVRFQLTNDGAYINNATFGGQSPTVFNAFTGGLTPAENSLTVLANQPNQAGEVELTVTLPRSFTGLQFTIFDVDFNSGQFADRVEVVGTSGGSTVLPTLTNGNVNFVVGNEAFGDGGSNNDQALGNVVVTFNQAVDTVIVRYGNHSTAPTDPGQQGIGVHDITVCNPFAQLSVTKVSSVIADPVNGNTNAKAIPGATVEYLITVSNTGPDAADADSVVIWDDGPADAKFCLLDRNGGPVIFADAGGNSGLTYDYGGAGSPAADLAVTTDDLEFSNDDGVSFAYVPTADGDQCDAAVTDFRVRPGGAFAAGSSVTLRVRYQVQ